MRTSLALKVAAIIAVWGLCGVIGQAQSPTTGATTPTRQTKPQAKTPANPINLNTATVTELEELPGVGPAIAARIVEYRQKNNGFKKLEDVMNVRGIGEKLFLKLKPMITITTKSLDR